MDNKDFGILSKMSSIKTFDFNFNKIKEKCWTQLHPMFRFIFWKCMKTSTYSITLHFNRTILAKLVNLKIIVLTYPYNQLGRLHGDICKLHIYTTHLCTYLYLTTTTRFMFICSTARTQTHTDIHTATHADIWIFWIVAHAFHELFSYIMSYS